MTVTSPDTVAPAAGAVTDTVGGVVSGGGWLDTVTATAVEVAWLPAASRARAVRLCEPLVPAVVGQVTEYGADVSSAPTAWPSTKKLTPATATLSAALAVTVIVARHGGTGGGRGHRHGGRRGVRPRTRPATRGSPVGRVTARRRLSTWCPVAVPNGADCLGTTPPSREPATASAAALR